MRGINQYAVFILAVSLALALVYFTVIASFFSRHGFTYQYGTATTQPIAAVELSDGVTVAMRAAEKGIVAKFSLKGDKREEIVIGEYPVLATAGNDIVVLDDAATKLVKLDGRLRKLAERKIEGSPMRRVYSTRSKILVPMKQQGRDVLAFYDFYLEPKNAASLPEPAIMSGDVYSYSYNGTCFVGILEKDITEILECNGTALAAGEYIFVLSNGNRVLKFDRSLRKLRDTYVSLEGKYIGVSEKFVYIGTESQVHKYSHDLDEQDCPVCRDLYGMTILGFSDRGHYAIAKSDQKAVVAALD